MICGTGLFPQPEKVSLMIAWAFFADPAKNLGKVLLKNKKSRFPCFNCAVLL